jgi:DNA polymerase-3 subunit beta
MKIIIKQTILMEHLSYVIRGISSKNLIPALNGIKFDIEEDGIYLSSTDNDIAIKSFIKKDNVINIEEVGSFIINGRYIYDIIKKLPNELIEIEEVLPSKINISTTNSSFTLNCVDVKEFPNLEIEESKTPIKISSELFNEIIHQTSFATSNQESRPVLTGINFKFSKNNLEVTATDSYRLSKKIVKLDDKVKEDINVIIPVKNLIEINRLFSSENSTIEMHVFNNKIIFKTNDLIVLSRLINGNYPDVSKLIPEDFTNTIEVNLEEFYNSIDRAALLTNDADKNTIRFQTNKGAGVVSSTIPEIGYVEEIIEIKKEKEDELQIAFSSKYMIDALKAFDSEKIKIYFNGEIKPIILKQNDSETLIQLILPIRTY